MATHDDRTVPIPLLGERVRVMREARAMSQDELAAQMDKPSRWIADVETGRHPQVEAQELTRLCEVLAVDQDYLLGHRDRLRPMHAPTMPWPREEHS